MTPDHAAAALELAAYGLPVFPVKPASKVPKIAGWPEAASTDPDIVRPWWTRCPDDNVGVAAGHRLGPGYVVVLDIDRHDPAQDGEEALLDLIAELGPLPDTLTVHTPTGGRHIYGLTPEPVGNGAGSNLPAGIDVRGLGGYVLAPPSVHPDGGRYEWDVENDLDTVIAELPPAWVARLTANTRPTNTKPATQSRPNPGNIFGAGQDRPGDAWAASTSWEAILTADGWTYAGKGADGEDQWTRPGKTVREGISATTAYGTHDVLKVFTSSAAPLHADETYTKLGYLATVHHHGDYDAAVDALRDAGYGAPRSSSSPSTPPSAVYEAADPDDEWATPIPLGDAERPPFPLDAFPAWVAAQAAQAAQEMQLTPDLAAQLAVTALSIVAGGRVEVKVNGRHHEPANTYTVTALPPSAGKSPTFRMMLGALDEWERRLVDEAAKAIDDRNLDRQVREKDRDTAIKQGELARAKELADELRDDFPPIHAPRLMADDATPEKLIDLLAHHNGRLGLVSTEGGLFGMMTGRYSDKANLDVYLGAWSGDTIRVDRIERGSTIVHDPALTIGLTVQPDVIARIGKDRELVGRGLTARFMYAVPADTVGRRDKRRESSYDDDVEGHYREELLGLAEYLDGEEGLLRLEFSPEARRRYLDWTADREEELGPYSALRYMAEWVAKCDSTVARLAALLHIAQDPTRTVIDLDTVENAITVGDYWTAHAKAAFDLMGASDDLGHARYLLGWLSSRTDDAAGEVTFRDLHQHAKRRVEKATDLVPAVELLVDYGWLRPAFDGRIYDHIGRGKTSPTFHVNPVLTVPHCPHIDPGPRRRHRPRPVRMTTMPMHICPQPGCPHVLDECPHPEHRPGGWQPDRVRGTKAERGYDAEWERARRAALRRSPRCTCGATATTVDHITPLAEGGARLELDNLRPLCERCHRRKTAADAARGRARAQARRRGQR